MEAKSIKGHSAHETSPLTEDILLLYCSRDVQGCWSLLEMLSWTDLHSNSVHSFSTPLYPQLQLWAAFGPHITLGVVGSPLITLVPEVTFLPASPYNAMQKCWVSFSPMTKSFLPSFPTRVKSSFFDITSDWSQDQKRGFPWWSHSTWCWEINSVLWTKEKSSLPVVSRGFPEASYDASVRGHFVWS